MVTLLLRPDKHLYVTSSNSNFQGEDNFETLKIISANAVSGHDLLTCNVECHIINPSNEGDIIQLTFIQEDDKLAAYIPLSNKYTSVKGSLTVFLKMFDKCNNSIGYTNEVNFEIRYHPDITKYIPDEQLTLIDQYSEIFQKALNLIDTGEIQFDEEKIKVCIENYLNTNEVTEKEIEDLFKEVSV